MSLLVEEAPKVNRSLANVPQILEIGPFTLIPQTSGDRFLGLGEVLHEDTPLRSPDLSWVFYTESEQGFRFDAFRNLHIERNGEECVTLHFESQGEWLPRAQEADAMGDARIRTRRIEAPIAHFQWKFRLVSESICGHRWDGLAMQLEVKSPGHPLHWIIEDTTWEIEGEAEGCTLIQQDISTIDLEQTTRKESAFSTIEKFQTDGWGGAYPMDMLPRAAGASIFDFQTKGDLALCLFTEKPSLSRARLEKFADENVIHYLDRPFFALTEHAVAPERKLLVYRHRSALKRHEWRNLWLDCFTEVRRRILKPFGFEPEIPVPTVNSHLWDDDLKRLGAAWLDPMREALPEFQRLGYRELDTHGVWDSITSDPKPAEPGNICCPYQFQFADAFGGNAGMKRLADAANDCGIKLYQWFSFHLSRQAEVWKNHPDWILREANGDPWDANYNTLWAGRYRSGYGTWTQEMIKATCRDAGLSGIFWDSYQNLGITCIDWGAPDKSPQANEIWAFQAELQKLGLGQRPEITTIFGVSSVAMYGFEDDKFRRRLWSDCIRNDEAFALLDTSPGFFSNAYPFTRELINPQLYFWLAAHRAIPRISAVPWNNRPEGNSSEPALPGGDLAEAYAEVNHLYNKALPQMKRLRLVENATHVLWLNDEGKPAVIWCFKEARIPHQGLALELRTGINLVCEGELELQAGQVWSLCV